MEIYPDIYQLPRSVKDEYSTLNASCRIPLPTPQPVDMLNIHQVCVCVWMWLCVCVVVCVTAWCVCGVCDWVCCVCGCVCDCGVYVVVCVTLCVCGDVCVRLACMWWCVSLTQSHSLRVCLCVRRSLHFHSVCTSFRFDSTCECLVDNSSLTVLASVQLTQEFDST